VAVPANSARYSAGRNMRVVVEDSESQAWYNMPWCKKTNADLIDRRTRDHLPDSAQQN
jgi:hypothetical protein